MDLGDVLKQVGEMNTHLVEITGGEPLLWQPLFRILEKHKDAFFQAILQGQQLELKANDYYKEYLAWLNTRDQAEAEKYWRNRLKGFTMPTPLVQRASGKISPQQKGWCSWTRRAMISINSRV
jgi:organic radical activating enzyme